MYKDNYENCKLVFRRQVISLVESLIRGLPISPFFKGLGNGGM